MTPVSDLYTVNEPTSLERATEVLCEHKVGLLPVLNSSGELTALLSRSDHVKSRDFPLASKDARGQLRVAAAVPVFDMKSMDKTLERSQRLLEAGADVLV